MTEPAIMKNGMAIREKELVLEKIFCAITVPGVVVPNSSHGRQLMPIAIATGVPSSSRTKNITITSVSISVHLFLLGKAVYYLAYDDQCEDPGAYRLRDIHKAHLYGDPA